MALLNQKNEYIRVVDVNLRRSVVLVEIYESQEARNNYDTQLKAMYQKINNKELKPNQRAEILKEIKEFAKTKQVVPVVCKIARKLKEPPLVEDTLINNIKTISYTAIKELSIYKNSKDV